VFGVGDGSSGRGQVSLPQRFGRRPSSVITDLIRPELLPAGEDERDAENDGGPEEPEQEAAVRPLAVPVGRTFGG
jgi:hypothetical protein